MQIIDQAAPTRRGEELDSAALEHYLLANLPDAAGPLSVAQFPGGFSNLTYLLHLGAQELVLRRPPFGAAIKSAHDMGREYRVLRALHPASTLKTPRPLLYCDDLDGDRRALLRDGAAARRHLARRTQRGQPRSFDLTPALMRQIAGAAIDNLAAIHAIDYACRRAGRLGATRRLRRSPARRLDQTLPRRPDRRPDRRSRR
jgi:aminoglycoside phosphotransferase (APT) family kinase protein